MLTWQILTKLAGSPVKAFFPFIIPSRFNQKMVF